MGIICRTSLIKAIKETRGHLTIVFGVFLFMWQYALPLQVSAEELKEASRPLVQANYLNTREMKQLWDFAGKLMKEGEFYRAITEYKRFISYYSDNPLVPTAYFNIGMAFFKGEKWDEARRAFIDYYQEFPEDKLVPQALFLIAQSDYQKGDYETALKEYMELGVRYSDQEIGHRAKYMVGWVLIKMRSWENAKQIFDQIDFGSPFYDSAQKLGGELQRAQALPRKDPPLAGVLSAVIPGTGQFYVGRYKDGLMALLVNGGFIGGALEAFHSGQDVLGGLLVFLGFSWYTGNIYSAVNSAHKYNRDQEDSLIMDLQNEHGSYLRISEKDDRFFITFKWDF